MNPPHRPSAVRRVLTTTAARFLAFEAMAAAALRLPESPPGLYLIVTALTVVFVGTAWQVDYQLLSQGHLTPRFDSAADQRAYNGPSASDTAASYLGALILTALAIAMIRSWVMILKARQPRRTDDAPPVAPARDRSGSDCPPPP